jgi:hypothetical protein
MLSSDLLAALTPVVAVLKRLGVTYYLGGSIVSSAYGMARSTLDADLVADLAERHVRPFVDSLGDAYYANAQAISDAIARKSCFNVIHLAAMFKIDVFAVKDRPYDRVALGRIRSDTLALEPPTPAFFLASPEDVVLNKLEWYRLGAEVSERQWQDVLGVLKVQRDSLNRAYLAKWAEELGVAGLLEQAWNEAGA